MKNDSLPAKPTRLLSWIIRTLAIVPVLGSAQCSSALPTQGDGPTSADNAPTSTVSQSLYALGEGLWTSRDIRVCWESLDNDANARDWVKDAITTSWQNNSALRFSFWDKCPPAGVPTNVDSIVDGFIRIKVGDEWPNCAKLGIDNADRPEACDFMFGRESQDAPHERWATQQGGWLAGMKFVAGDFDNDGFADVAAVFEDTGFTSIDVHQNVLQTTPDGTRHAMEMHRAITKEGPGNTLMQVVAADFTGDGLADIATVSSIPNQVVINLYVGNGAGGFAFEGATSRADGTSSAEHLFFAVDINHDGRDELGVAYDDGGLVSIDTFHNGPAGDRFNGRTRVVTSQAPWVTDMHAMAGDFDNDGFDDVATAFNEAGANSVDVFRNDQHGALVQSRWSTQQGLWSSSFQWAAGNFDGEGADDIVHVISKMAVGKEQAAVYLYKQPTGEPRFDRIQYSIANGGWIDNQKWVAGNFAQPSRKPGEDGGASTPVPSSALPIDLMKMFEDVGNAISFDFVRPRWMEEGERQDVIRHTAIHEFGHALGFAHEQTRPDSPAACKTDEKDKGDIYVTEYDPFSVMNYCAGTPPRLSALDVVGLRTLYQEPPKFDQGRTLTQDGGWSTHMFFVNGDFDGDHDVDVAVVFEDANLISIDVQDNQGPIDIGGTRLSFTRRRALTRQGSWTGESMRFLAADFNRDGFTDIAVIFDHDGMISIDIDEAIPGGGFKPPRRAANQQGGITDTMKFMIGDFNHDQWPDIADVYEFNGQSVFDVHENDQQGGFVLKRAADAQGNWHETMQFVVGDFNGDGWDDIAKAFNNNGEISIDLHRNKQTNAEHDMLELGRASDNQGVWADSFRFMAGDFDQDGRFDIAGVFKENVCKQVKLEYGCTHICAPLCLPCIEGCRDYIDIDIHRNNGSGGFELQRGETRHGIFTEGGQWLAGTFHRNAPPDLLFAFKDNEQISMDIHRNLMTGAPVAVCRDITREAGASCQAAVSIEELDGGSFDPDHTAVTLSVNLAGPYGRGDTYVTLTVTSDGRSSKCLAKVTVTDTVNPVVTPPPAVRTSHCGAVNLGHATASDACDIKRLTNNAPAVFPLGQTVVTWTATDNSDRVATATQIVTTFLGDDASCCPSGSHVMIGTAGNDVLTGTAGSDCILGLGGNDTIQGLGGDDYLSGGAGTDTINGGDGDDHIMGGDGNDTLTGGNGNDTIEGGAGDDVISCGTGNDLAFGNEGRDVINGDSGADTLSGGDGNDVISGGADNDDISGDGGDDVLSGGTGTNEIDGGEGRDVCSGGSKVNCE